MDQRHGRSVEAYEDSSSRASSFESDDAVGEIPSSFQNAKTGFHGHAVNNDGRAFNQLSDGRRDFHSVSLVTARQHPNEFA